MRRHLSLLSVPAVALALLAGCAGGGGGAAGTTSQPPAASSTVAQGTPEVAACSGGLKGTEPGVLRITCDGPAEVKIQAGGVTTDLHGGQCRSVGDRWSVSVGVIIDETGAHGTYSGPPVNSIAVNNTDQAGKATIQAVLGGKHYFDLGNANLTLSGQGATAHLEGVSERLSDLPSAKITVDLTC